AVNVNRANEALDLLRLYGTPVAGLALIDSAAGFANAPGIEAISLVPTVAYVHLDATVVPALDPLPTPTPLPTLPPLATPTPVPTLIPTPTPSPTAPPTPAPTAPPTPAPTVAPTPAPTVAPTPAPTATPIPTATPAAAPNDASASMSTETPTPTPTAQTQGSAVYSHVVNADQLWSQGTTGRGVTVAVLDS